MTESEQIEEIRKRVRAIASELVALEEATLSLAARRDEKFDWLHVRERIIDSRREIVDALDSIPRTYPP